MALSRRILDFCLGERGPADIVRTRSGEVVTFRLPNLRRNRRRWTGWFVIALIFGVPLIFVALVGAMIFPPETRSRVVPFFFIAVLLVSVSAILGKWRFAGHYEILLTPELLAIDCISSLRRRRLLTLELASVEQLTVVRQLRLSFLQAETAGQAPRVLLREHDHQVLVQLANLLALEQPALRVAFESPHGVRPERSAPPLNSRILLTAHDAGISLDFPLVEDPRHRGRRLAWRTFEAGIFILMGTLIAFAACAMGQWRELQPFLGLPFVVGLICLATAARQSWATWQDTRADDELRQLRVVGNILIRTSRDHRKQVWYRDEIRAIALEEKIERHEPPSEGGIAGNFVLYCLLLVVELHNGEKATLTRRASPHPTDDYRPKAELEWIATQLRQSLFANADEPTPATQNEPLAHAIRTADRHAVKSEPEA
jgi:MFS family permease